MNKRKFRAQISELDAIIKFVENYFRAKHVSAKCLQEILVTVDEVVTNIIHFAYEAPEEGPLEITLGMEGKMLIMTFVDRGKPFDPTTFKEPDINLPLRERKPGGLGIHLVRNLMNSVQYEYRDNMNVLTLIKEYQPENNSWVDPL